MFETAEQITEKLTAWTVAHSGHQPRRDYIGLSQCSLPVDEIIRTHRDGFQTPSEKDHCKFYKGYQLEADLLRRLRAVFRERVQPGGEISAFGGLVKGHPDFTLDGFPGDCKTVPLDEHLPIDGHLPRRVFFQMQGYMLYSGKERALVIYESRENGLLRAFWVYPNRRVQDQINETLSQAVAIIRGAA